MQNIKKENLCEFSLIGIKSPSDLKLKAIIEEIAENSSSSFCYEIKSYKLQYRSTEGIDNLFNLIEIHKNLNESYKK